MIRFENVSFGYRNGWLFRGLNLELRRGAIYGLLGKNGAGKSTLLKLAAGLLFPNTGEISVLGRTPKRREPTFLSRIFLVPEEFDLPRMNMREYARVYGCFYPDFSGGQLAELMRELEVSETQPFQQMSLGQKKKACIAFAIACRTPLLLMDEPTNGLDIPSKSAFRRVVASVMNENRTIVISTHQVRDLDRLIDSVVVLDESEILLNATTEEITRRLQFVRLEEGEQALYAEETIHGRWGVRPNESGADSPLDMELLFNAAIANREAMKNLFNRSER
ncbi:ABC transporter ATP-binding protein [uncultured Rikenella sp.]|uniref:ABC transporter ATP-binding protein n=1 Tax=uncultured Rikenella sp. TaxID=368003 RepID=UPI0025FC7C61|nr:ABC transporter ATP-binding protein [uncultured Rikenella sp.]